MSSANKTNGHRMMGHVVFGLCVLLTIIGLVREIAWASLWAFSLLSGKTLTPGLAALGSFESSCLWMLVATATYYLGKETG